MVQLYKQDFEQYAKIQEQKNRTIYLNKIEENISIFAGYNYDWATKNEFVTSNNPMANLNSRKRYVSII